MIRIKTLSLPLITTLVSSVAQPANAQVALALSSQKSYRQDKNSIDFQGGSFSIRFNDGLVTTIGGCNDFIYYPPGRYVGACSPGTTGYLSSGTINGATVQRPYLLVTGLQQAVIIEPLEANRIKLTAAPASKLARPSGGFQDDSFSVFYNLTVPNSIREYGVTRYFLNRNYNENQRTKFDQEIVTGVYNYSFPRLGAPNMPAVIKAVIYPMAEGLIKKNNRETGFEFTSVNGNSKFSGGYLPMSFSRPNVIKWKGLTSSVVFAAVDKLHFSMRALRNPRDPANSTVVTTSSIFPAFTGAASDSRVLLTNPYVTSFTVPPIFPTGTTAMVQLELERNFQTGGVTYDFSKRTFQIPVKVVDTFNEYKATYLAGVNQGILADPDGDGFNSLTEWILDSDGSESGSIPIAPVPADFQAVDLVGFPILFGSYFGFNVNIKQGTDPAVIYTLQRSKDQGATWENFVEGYYLTDGTYSEDPPPATFPPTPFNWSVQRVTTNTRGILTTQIQVRSGIPTTDTNATIPTIEPPGTLSDIYRVKITRDR